MHRAQGLCVGLRLLGPVQLLQDRMESEVLGRLANDGGRLDLKGMRADGMSLLGDLNL